MRGLPCIALAILATACSPFGGDDCAARAEASDDAPPPHLDPETLLCRGDDPWCNPDCGVCPEPEPAPQPSWSWCQVDCNGVDERTCLLSTACRAIYDHGCFTGEGPCTLEAAYVGCYGTDMTGPIQGSCIGLDAFECSRHDDCFALHTQQCNTSECWWQFVECRDEDSCWGPVICTDAPPMCPPGSTPQIENGCYTGDCTPLDECEPMPPP